MISPTLSSRRGLPLVLLVLAGCQNGDDTTGEATTVAGSSTAGTGTGTGTGTGGATEEQPTGGVQTTTDEPPVPCDTPEGCTGMGEGDLQVTLPFFRGRVCASDSAQPGDALAVSVSTCVHPCLKVESFKQKWVYRCDGACEVALVFYHPEVTGTACPADVFGEFNPAICDFVAPIEVSLAVPETMGSASLLLPFMTNDDVAAILGGDDMGPAVWARIDAHTQAPGRRIALDFAPDNAAAPMACGEGVAGCTCVDIGL